MCSKRYDSKTILGIGAVAGLMLSAAALDFSLGDRLAHGGLISAAHAAEGGSGKGGPGGSGGSGGSGVHGQQGGSGGAGVPRAPEGGGKPDDTGGGGTSSGGVILGRLSMAKAYQSPKFDPSKIDDPEAPLANLEAYRTILLDGKVYPADGSDPIDVAPTLENLASYLAKVATAAINGDSILTVNGYLEDYQSGVEAAFAATGIDPDALATRVNELVKENRE